MRLATFNKKIYALLLTVAILLFSVFSLSFWPKHKEKATATWLSTNNYAASFSNSSGTAHYISNGAQLARLAFLMNKSNEYDTYSSHTYYLSNNIDISQHDWDPIGTLERPFKGEFNGNGHVITGLKITREQHYVGLFGNAESATFSSFMIIGNINFAQSGHFIGGVAGRAKFSTFTRISSNVNINAEKSDYVGGIVGVYVNSLTMSLSQVSHNTTIVGKLNVGGLIGGYGEDTGQVKIDNVYNNGSKVKGHLYVGGIIGYGVGMVPSSFFGFHSHLKSSYNNALVEGTGSVGGIVGDNSRINIEGVYNFNQVIGGNFTGGIVGSAIAGGLNIKKATNMGKISGTSGVGGIAGSIWQRGTYEDVSNFGDVTGTEDSVGGIVGDTLPDKIIRAFNQGNITGKTKVGGILGGEVLFYPSDSDMDIEYVANHGNITATINTSDEGSFAGGIVGEHSHYRVTLNINYSYNIGTIDGLTDRGGLIGYIYALNKQSTTSIKNSYSMGSINDNGESKYVGALIGRNRGDNVKNTTLHFLSGSSNPDNGFGTRAGGGTNSSNGTATAHSKISGISSALTGSYWVKTGAFPTISGINYNVHDNFVAFSEEVWEIDGAGSINNGLPFLKNSYWAVPQSAEGNRLTLPEPLSWQKSSIRLNAIINADNTITAGKSTNVVLGGSGEVEITFASNVTGLSFTRHTVTEINFTYNGRSSGNVTVTATRNGKTTSFIIYYTFGSGSSGGGGGGGFTPIVDLPY